MRLLFFLLLTAVVPANAQNRNKNALKAITDSVFRAGDRMILPVVFAKASPACTPETGPMLNVYADFLTRHKELFFTVSVNIDNKTKDTTLFRLCEARAKGVRDSLVARGVLPEKISWEVEKTNSRENFGPCELHLVQVTRSKRDTVFHAGDIIPCNWVWGDRGIRPELRDSLDALLKFVQTHPELSFEVASHTDSRGADAANEKLSAQRAVIIRDYLVKKGIYPPRLTSKGYGEKEPLFSDRLIYASPTKELQEKLHQLNRRTYLRVMANAKEGRH